MERLSFQENFKKIETKLIQNLQQGIFCYYASIPEEVEFIRQYIDFFKINFYIKDKFELNYSGDRQVFRIEPKENSEYVTLFRLPISKIRSQFLNILNPKHYFILKDVYLGPLVPKIVDSLNEEFSNKIVTFEEKSGNVFVKVDLNILKEKIFDCDKEILSIENGKIDVETESY